ncbi:hypothetical protein OsccyDRAFT_0588 [Leptolyngbyaceae cyanobacterium JSC-12]|nr:hypothetical protein OsccyDRAFT_0588 [Leptolyngbyaceae cyanobacterium JSC-12]
MIVDYNPKSGIAFQGDLMIYPLQKSFKIDQTQEVSLKQNKISLLEGESSGHVHAVYADSTLSDRRSLEALYTLEAAPAAKFYLDEAAATKVVDDPNLMIGFLVVERPVIIAHTKNNSLTGEHNSIRLQPGNYFIGRQREFSSKDVRVVAD